MRSFKLTFVVFGAMILSLTRCSCEDDPASSSDNPFQKLTGIWKMTSFEYQSNIDSNLKADLVHLGLLTLTWEIKKDGNYSYSGTSNGFPFSGTEKLEGNDDDFDDGDDGTVFTLEGDKLTIFRQEDFYDFGNGNESANSTQIFVRQ